MFLYRTRSRFAVYRTLIFNSYFIVRITYIARYGRRGATAPLINHVFDLFYVGRPEFFRVVTANNSVSIILFEKRYADNTDVFTTHVNIACLTNTFVRFEREFRIQLMYIWIFCFPDSQIWGAKTSSYGKNIQFVVWNTNNNYLSSEFQNARTEINRPSENWLWESTRWILYWIPIRGRRNFWAFTGSITFIIINLVNIMYISLPLIFVFSLIQIIILN